VENLNKDFKSQITNDIRFWVKSLSKPIEGSQFGCTTIPLVSDEERESGSDWFWDSNTNRVVACPEVRSIFLMMNF